MEESGLNVGSDPYLPFHLLLMSVCDREMASFSPPETLNITDYDLSILKYIYFH